MKEKDDRLETAVSVEKFSHTDFWSTETLKHLKHLFRAHVHYLYQSKTLTLFEINQDEKVIKKCHPDIGIVVELSILIS